MKLKKVMSSYIEAKLLPKISIPTKTNKQTNKNTPKLASIKTPKIYNKLADKPERYLAQSQLYML